MTELGRSLFLAPCGGGPVLLGRTAAQESPQKRLTNEGLFFLGVLAIAGSLARSPHGFTRTAGKTSAS